MQVCTCRGTCYGPERLGPGWVCALSEEYKRSLERIEAYAKHLSPVVTEQWCREMGFFRRFDPIVVAAGHREWCLEKGLRCLIVVEFSDDWCVLSVEEKTSCESVVLTNYPTQRDIEYVDELVRRPTKSQPERTSA